MAKYYDVIILGLGAMGSAALYQMSVFKRTSANQLTVLGIEQFISPHAEGSSHGETRITRSANYRNPIYVELAKRSQTLFQEIAAKSNEKFGKLYYPCGGLIISRDQQEDDATGQNLASLKAIAASATRHHIDHRLFSNTELKNKFPQFNFPQNIQAYFENSMGYLEPENCIAAQLALAKQNNFEIAFQTKIQNYRLLNNGIVELKDDKGNFYHTKKLLICSGPWVADFLPKEYQAYFKIYRQTLGWFAIQSDFLPLFQADQFPVFIWYLNDQAMFYGFPAINKAKNIKIAIEFYADYVAPYFPLKPDNANREVSIEEKQNMIKMLQPYINGMLPQCARATTCFYTMTAKGEFIIDYLPGYEEKIILVSPCSGHGFKHSAAIGELLVKMIFENRVIEAFKFN